MWTKIKDIVTFLAALGAFWTLITNPAVKTEWPTIGNWLAPIGLLLILLFSLAHAVTLSFSLANVRMLFVYDRNPFGKRSTTIFSRKGNELAGIVGSFDPEGTDRAHRARANVIIHKLVHDHIVHPKFAALRGDRVHEHVTALTTTVEKFGADFAREKSNELIRMYLPDAYSLLVPPGVHSQLPICPGHFGFLRVPSLDHIFRPMCTSFYSMPHCRGRQLLAGLTPRDHVSATKLEAPSRTTSIACASNPIFSAARRQRAS